MSAVSPNCSWMQFQWRLTVYFYTENMLFEFVKRKIDIYIFVILSLYCKINNIPLRKMCKIGFLLSKRRKFCII